MRAVIWIGLILILVYLFGAPSSINIPGFGWDLNDQNEQPAVIVTPPVEEDEPIKDIIISSIEPRQEIYEPGDTAFVDIEIKNGLNLEYNISVEWYYNNIRYLGWFNKSTENYDTKITDNPYWSSYGPLNNKGAWILQTVIKYHYQNKTYSKGKTTQVSVV